MKRSIIGFHQDEELDWVAELDCGHCQHTRHHPPFFPRPWVVSEGGRASRIGSPLNCILCDRSIPPENQIDTNLTSGEATECSPLPARNQGEHDQWR